MDVWSLIIHTHSREHSLYSWTEIPVEGLYTSFNSQQFSILKFLIIFEQGTWPLHFAPGTLFSCPAHPLSPLSLHVIKRLPKYLSNQHHDFSFHCCCYRGATGDPYLDEYEASQSCYCPIQLPACIQSTSFKTPIWGLPGDPMVKNPPSKCRRHGFDPSQGN